MRSQSVALCGVLLGLALTASPGAHADGDLRFGIVIEFGLPGKFLIRREGLVEASPDGRSLQAKVKFEPGNRLEEIAWLKMAEKDARYTRSERRAISELIRSLSRREPQYLMSPYRFRTGTLGKLRELAHDPARAEASLQAELTTLLVDMGSKEVSFLERTDCASWFGPWGDILRN